MLELPSDPFNFLEEEAMNGVCHLFILKVTQFVKQRLTNL